MDGIVKRFNKGVAWVEVADEARQIFAHVSDVVSGHLSENARVSFDKEDTAKGPRAKNIRVTAPGTPAPNPSPPPDPKAISVEWHFGRVTVHQIIVSPNPPEDRLALPVALMTRRGTQNKPMLVVEFKVDGNTLYSNVTTSGSGYSDFPISELPLDTKTLFFSAVIKDGNEQVLVQKVWTMPEAPQAAAAPVVDDTVATIDAKKFGPTANGFVQVRILAHTAEGTGASDEVDYTGAVEIKQGGHILGAGEAIAVIDGRALIEIRPTNPKQTTEVVFHPRSNIAQESTPIVFDAIPDTPPAPPVDLTGYELYWQRTRITPGQFRVHLVVRNAEGKSAPAKISVTAREEVNINGAIVPKGDTTEDTLPVGGKTLAVTLTARRANLDIYLLETSRHYEVVLRGPQPKAPAVTVGDGKGRIAHLVAGWQGRHPQNRFYMFWMPLLLLLYVYFGASWTPLVVTSGVIGLMIFRLIRGNEAAADRMNVRFGDIMKTNNQWLGVWSLTTVVSIILTLLIAVVIPGAPSTDETQSTPTKVATSADASEDQQRDRNLERYGMYETDAEIQADIQAGRIKPVSEPAKASEPTYTDRAKRGLSESFSSISQYLAPWLLPDESGWGWAMRLLALLTLVVATLAYIPFALSDEVMDKLETRGGGEEGGQKTWLDLLRNFHKIPKTSPLSTAGTAVKWGGWQWLMAILAADEVREIVAAIIRLLRR